MLWAVALAILLLLYAYTNYSDLMNGQASGLLIVVFGGFVSFDGIGIMQALAFCMLFAVQLTLLGNEFRGDFETASAYLFTRGVKRRHWLFGKFVSVVEQSLVYYLILFATILCCVPMLGFAFDAANVFTVLACLLPTLALTNTLLVLAVNIFTIRMSVPLVYAITLAFYTGWISLLPLMRDFQHLLRLVPVTRSILLIHDFPPFLNEMQEALSTNLRISVYCTIIWMLLGIAILYTASFIWIRTTDLSRGNDM